MYPFESMVTEDWFELFHLNFVTQCIHDKGAKMEDMPLKKTRMLMFPHIEE